MPGKKKQPEKKPRPSSAAKESKRGGSDLPKILDPATMKRAPALMSAPTSALIRTELARTLIGLTDGDLDKVAEELQCPPAEVEALLEEDLQRVRAAAQETPNDLSAVARRVALTKSVVRGLLAVGRKPDEETAARQRRLKAFLES